MWTGVPRCVSYVEDNGVYKFGELQFFHITKKTNVRTVLQTRSGSHTYFMANQLVSAAGGPIKLIPMCKNCDNFANKCKLKNKIRGKTQFFQAYTGNKNLPYFIKYGKLGTINIRK